MMCLVKKLFLSSIAESLWELGWGVSGRGSANGTKCWGSMGWSSDWARTKAFLLQASG